jgi:2-methylcitrate dehydratase PrpD
MILGQKRRAKGASMQEQIKTLTDDGVGAAGPARRLAEFVAGLSDADVPAGVREHARLLILDAVGVALAATRYPFAARALAGARALGGVGTSVVIGQREGLPARDAALVNGVLVHGLDFDDSHLTAIVHPTVMCLPAALAVGTARQTRGADLLTAYIAGMECAIRLGASVRGGFHAVGFHATGVLSHFAAALVAGRLYGLNADALVHAQGIAASTAAGVQVFLEEGAWTKRLHPGWGAAAGITAAVLAQNGFLAPSRAYEGRFGLFETHLQAHARAVDLASISAGLGAAWKLTETSIKPYPICHFLHGAAEAAIELHGRLNGPALDLIEICVSLPEPTLAIVAEPAARKREPANDYDAKFSAQYVVATCLAKGRIGLAELDSDALSDPQVLELARRVSVEADAATGFPRVMFGGVRIKTAEGQLEAYIPVNKGSAERALSAEAIEAKYFAAAELGFPHAKARRIRDAILALDAIRVEELAETLRA